MTETTQSNKVTGAQKQKVSSAPATGILFISAGCPSCPPAKEAFKQLRVERKDIELHTLSAQTREGQELARQFGVQSVPTFVFYGPGHEKPMGLVGGQTLEVLHNYVDISLGKAELPEEKKFSIRNLFKKK